MTVIRNGIDYGNLVQGELFGMKFVMDEFYQNFVKLLRPGVEVDSDLEFETEFRIEVEYGNGRYALVFVLDGKDMENLASAISALTGLPTRTASGNLIHGWWENGALIRQGHVR